jgi:hypothetical protein
VLCTAILIQFVYAESDLSTIGSFTASIEVLLVMYAVMPMPLFVAIGIGVTHYPRRANDPPKKYNHLLVLVVPKNIHQETHAIMM